MQQRNDQKKAATKQSEQSEARAVEASRKRLLQMILRNEAERRDRRK